MIHKPVIVLIVLAALSSGCAVKTNSMKVSSPGMEIELSSGNGGHGGAVHCPPGQAKKGRC